MLAEWNQSLVPADIRETAVKLEQTLELYGKPDNWAAVAKFYLEALEDVPADLVDKALRQVRRTCKWFPKPSEIRQPVEKDMTRRKIIALQLESRLRFGRFA